jgi:hypothetical protein
VFVSHLLPLPTPPPFLPPVSAVNDVVNRMDENAVNHAPTVVARVVWFGLKTYTT